MNGTEIGLLLGVDTSTHASIVVIGGSEPIATSTRDVQHRHGSHLLEQIDEVLLAARVTLDDVTALAVGTGPGSFTGLRVGMATVKTIAYAQRLPLVGVASSDVLRRAATHHGVDPGAAVVLPAGAHDHYLAIPGDDAVLIARGDLRTALGSRQVVSVDMDAEILGAEAAAAGRQAIREVPAALLAAARDRLDAGDVDTAAELVPAYVALPRGVTRAAEDLGWSPDLR